MTRKLLLAAGVAAMAQAASMTLALAAPPSTEVAYANGKLVNISTPNNSHNTGKNTAAPFYLVVWTGTLPDACQQAVGTMPSTDPCTPIDPINGYSPNCNPCHHFGVITPLDYHDHILAGAPGAGKNGTAWAYNPMWHVYLVLYNPVYLNGGDFVPFTSDETMLDAMSGPSAGDYFLPVSGLADAGVPGFEVSTYLWDTTIVFQCNVVSFKAA